MTPLLVAMTRGVVAILLGITSDALWAQVDRPNAWCPSWLRRWQPSRWSGGSPRRRLRRVSRCEQCRRLAQLLPFGGRTVTSAAQRVPVAAVVVCSALLPKPGDDGDGDLCVAADPLGVVGGRVFGAYRFGARRYSSGAPCRNSSTRWWRPAPETFLSLGHRHQSAAPRGGTDPRRDGGQALASSVRLAVVAADSTARTGGFAAGGDDACDVSGDSGGA
jgi:hypothetical protein